MKKTLLLLLGTVLASTTLAQSNDSLVVLFLSDPGIRPAEIFTDGFESDGASRFDANGDGTIDLILRRDDTQGNLQDIRVLDGRTRDVFWAVQDVPTALGFDGGFPLDLWGFADLYGDGKPKALFVGQTDLRAYDLNPNTLSWSWADYHDASVRLVGLTDLTNNGLLELIVLMPDTKQVQIWGKAD